MAATSSQFELPNPPSDAISTLACCPEKDSTKLLVASWDCSLYLYDTHSKEGGEFIRRYEHRAPVLDVCWGKGENEAFTAGLDWDVRAINLDTGAQTLVSTHAEGVISVVYDPATELLVSASWDRTLHLHNLLKPGSPHRTIALPEKPFAVSISRTKLVVAMAARTLHIYDLATLADLAADSSAAATPITPDPLQRRESSLKFLTRAVAAMPDDAGYASSSIEGRVAVDWFDTSAASQARKYAFKCHRAPAPDDPAVDVVYPVNALAFHPSLGTFASGGGDGVASLWDAAAKRRIRQFQHYPHAVVALGFSASGRTLAIASSPGFEDGGEATPEGSAHVFVRNLADDEAMSRLTKRAAEG